MPLLLHRFFMRKKYTWFYYSRTCPVPVPHNSTLKQKALKPIASLPIPTLPYHEDPLIWSLLPFNFLESRDRPCVMRAHKFTSSGLNSFTWKPHDFHHLLWSHRAFAIEIWIVHFVGLAVQYIQAKNQLDWKSIDISKTILTLYL